MKQMSSPGGNVGGVVGGVGSVGGVGGGVFPPQISPQQLAMLSNIYPHMQQFHLVGDLIDIDIRHSAFSPSTSAQVLFGNCLFACSLKLTEIIHNKDLS